MAVNAWTPDAALTADKTGASPHWQYLEARPHSWRRQLCLKGRRQSAFSAGSTMQTEGPSVAEAAGEWDLSPEAVQEIVRYCEENRELLGQEADQEKQWLEHGIALEPAPAG